jgi:hypothetical protein
VASVLNNAALKTLFPLRDFRVRAPEIEIYHFINHYTALLPILSKRNGGITTLFERTRSFQMRNA